MLYWLLGQFVVWTFQSTLPVRTDRSRRFCCFDNPSDECRHFIRWTLEKNFRMKVFVAQTGAARRNWQVAVLGDATTAIYTVNDRINAHLIKQELVCVCDEISYSQIKTRCEKI